MHRAAVGLSVLFVSITGVTVHAIPPPPPDDVRFVRVLDGHTVVVSPDGEPLQVRLACIHSPPLDDGAAGLAAKSALDRPLPPGAWLTLAKRSKAPDGVELAQIIPSGTTVPLNLRLVQDGMALLDRQTLSLCNQDRYREAEWRARNRRLGLW